MHSGHRNVENYLNEMVATGARIYRWYDGDDHGLYGSADRIAYFQFGVILTSGKTETRREIRCYELTIEINGTTYQGYAEWYDAITSVAGPGCRERAQAHGILISAQLKPDVPEDYDQDGSAAKKHIKGEI
jgi:hypothetical protein